MLASWSSGWRGFGAGRRHAPLGLLDRAAIGREEVAPRRRDGVSPPLLDAGPDVAHLDAGRVEPLGLPQLLDDVVERREAEAEGAGADVVLDDVDAGQKQARPGRAAGDGDGALQAPGGGGEERPGGRQLAALEPVEGAEDAGLPFQRGGLERVATRGEGLAGQRGGLLEAPLHQGDARRDQQPVPLGGRGQPAQPGQGRLPVPPGELVQAGLAQRRIVDPPSMASSRA